MELMQQDWTEGWQELQKYSKKFGQASALGNMEIIRSMQDELPATKTEKGQAVFTQTWVVPKAMEKEMDDFWADHEKWMRSSHSIGATKPTDDKTPHLTNYTVAKGPQMVDPFDRNQGETDNIVYTESESYPEAEGVDKHIALAKEKWSEGWKKMKEYSDKYSVSTNLSNSKVITSTW